MAKTESMVRLNELLDKAEVNIRRAFLNAVDDSKSAINISDLVRLLESGDIEGAVKLVESVPLSTSIQIKTEMERTGQSTFNLIATVISKPVVYDSLTNRAISIIQNDKLRLIREFSEDQRLITRDILIEGVSRQINPIEQARGFRDSIGLTQRQRQAVERYRNLLETRSSEVFSRQLRDRRFDRTISRAIEQDKNLTKIQIDKMVDRYRERYLKYRAEVIARTESLRAVNAGNDEAFKQAIENGNLEADKLIRRWNTVLDGRERGWHASMNGQKRKIGEPFVSGRGNELMRPGDPSAPGSETIQCRCVVTTTFLD